MYLPMLDTTLPPFYLFSPPFFLSLFSFVLSFSLPLPIHISLSLSHIDGVAASVYVFVVPRIFSDTLPPIRVLIDSWWERG